jgi:hypothetical protein
MPLLRNPLFLLAFLASAHLTLPEPFFLFQAPLGGSVLLMPLTLLGDLFFKTPPLCSLRPCSGFVIKSDPFSLISVLALPFLQDFLSLLPTPLFLVGAHDRSPFLCSLHPFSEGPPSLLVMPLLQDSHFSTAISLVQVPPLFAGYTPPCSQVPLSLRPCAPISSSFPLSAS